MTLFQFQPRVGDHDRFSAALGVSNSTPLKDADIGKPVKLAASNNYVQCSSADELEGIVESIEPNKVNSGFGFGVVQKGGRALATVAGGTLAVGALVVAGTQAAVNTANTANNGIPVVIAGAPTKFLWRIISTLTGGGVVGSVVVIERIGT